MSVPANSETAENLPLPWEDARKTLANQQGETTPIEKAAIILAAIGPETAADFLKGMSEGSLTRTASAISNMERVPEEMLDAVIAEFLLSIGTEEEVAGGALTARRLLAEVLDNKTVEKIMFDVGGGDTRSAWKKLNDSPIQALTKFIGAEHPQTAAVILSELKAEKAAAIIERLDRSFAQQTVLRLSRVPALRKRVSAMVERTISQDFLLVQEQKLQARNPAELIADLMNNLSTEAREKFLEHLEEQNPQLVKEVQRVMFTFADIQDRVSPLEVGAIIKAVDEAVLTAALKSAMAAKLESADFILANISKRLSERLVEDMEAMPLPSTRDAESAQQEVVRAIQVLVKLGTMTLIKSTDDDD